MVLQGISSTCAHGSECYNASVKNQGEIYYNELQYHDIDGRILDHQSGHRSRRWPLPSSSGASCCFIHRSGTCVADLEWRNSFHKYDVAHQWEVALHRTEEPMSVLLRADDRRLSPVRATKESRILDPTFELLIPSVCPDVVYVAG